MINIKISSICLLGIIGFLCLGPWFNYLEYHNFIFSFPLGIILFECSFIYLIIFYAAKIKFSFIFTIFLLLFIIYIAFVDLIAVPFDNNIEFINILRKNIRIFIISYLFSKYLPKHNSTGYIINCFLFFVFLILINNWHAYGLDFVDRNKSNCPTRTTLVYTILVALTLKIISDKQVNKLSLNFIFLIIFFISISVGSRQILLFSLISFIICSLYNKKFKVLFVILPILLYILSYWVVNVDRLYNFSTSISLANRFLFYHNFMDLNLLSLLVGPRNIDSSLYPSHNLFAYFEQFGIIFFLFYLFFIFFLFYRVFSLHSSTLRFTCLIFCFTSLFSASFANYYIFFLSGILLKKFK